MKLLTSIGLFAGIGVLLILGGNAVGEACVQATKRALDIFEYEKRSEFYELHSIHTDSQERQNVNGVFVCVIGTISAETEYERSYIAYVKHDEGIKAERFPVDITFINEISVSEKPYLEKQVQDTKMRRSGEVIDSKAERYILNVPEGSVSMEFDFGLEGFAANAAA